MGWTRPPSAITWERKRTSTKLCSGMLHRTNLHQNQHLLKIYQISKFRYILKFFVLHFITISHCFFVVISTVKRPKFGSGPWFRHQFGPIGTFYGIKVVDIVSKSTGLLVCSSTIKNYNGVRYRTQPGTQMAWYDLQQFRLFFKKWQSSIHFSKFFCVSEFDKMAVTSTPAENNIFRAHKVFKLFHGVQNHVEYKIRHIQNFE